MLHLRRMGLLDLDVLTVTNRTLGENLNEWEHSERRNRFQEILKEQDGIEATDVILSPERAQTAGITQYSLFSKGNLAPRVPWLRVPLLTLPYWTRMVYTEKLEPPESSLMSQTPSSPSKVKPNHL